MTCMEINNLLSAYVDGELDSERSLTIKSHVQRCSSCLSEVKDLQVLTSAVENGSLRFKAPPHLKRNVITAIRAENPRTRSSFFAWRWASALAAAGLIAVLAWAASTRWMQNSDQQIQLVHDIVSSHVRSMMANHITDVSSSDSHTVKPWFGGKLDYSPPAKDLTEQGFRLVGGRLDYLENRPVAALVYQRKQHFINLFVWPSNRSTIKQDGPFTIQGYNVIHWTDSDMTYWLVSELNLSELNECARLLKESMVGVSR
jgi:anti-sigma factor RsiW